MERVSPNSSNNLQSRALASDSLKRSTRRQEILQSSPTYGLLFQSDTPAVQELLDYAFTFKLAKDKPELLADLSTQLTQDDLPPISALNQLQACNLPDAVAVELEMAGVDSTEWKQFWFPEFGTDSLSDQARIEAKRFSFDFASQNLEQELNKSTELPATTERVRDTLARDRNEFQGMSSYYDNQVEDLNVEPQVLKSTGFQMENGLHMQRIETLLAGATLLDPKGIEQTKRLQQTARTWDESFETAGLEASSDYAVSMPPEWKTIVESVCPDMASGTLGFAYDDRFAMFRPDLADVMAAHSADYPLIDHVVTHELVHLNQKTNLSRVETIHEARQEPYGMRELVEGLTEYKTVEILSTRFGPGLEAEYKAKHPAAQYTAYHELAKTIVQSLPEHEQQERVQELFQKEWYTWQKGNNLNSLNIRPDQVHEMVTPLHSITKGLIDATNGQPTAPQIREFVCEPYQEIMQEYARELNPNTMQPTAPEPQVAKPTTLRDRLNKARVEAGLNSELDYLMQTVENDTLVTDVIVPEHERDLEDDHLSY